MEKKLYKAIASVTALFLSDDDNYIKDTNIHIQSEYVANGFEYSTTEITSYDEIPYEWTQNESLLWGTDKVITANQFLDRQRTKKNS